MRSTSEAIPSEDARYLESATIDPTAGMSPSFNPRRVCCNDRNSSSHVSVDSDMKNEMHVYYFMNPQKLIKLRFSSNFAF
jgi:hypothetical protein